ncbi:MAG TPA: prepilin-type N-terminal cleavage/methylation domain-containing protein [Cellulomonas sp.]
MRDRLPEARPDAGFTLVELLVVVIILGILSAVAVPLYLNQQTKARAATVRSDLRTVAVHVQAAILDGADPDDLYLGVDLGPGVGMSAAAVASGDRYGYALCDKGRYQAVNGAGTGQTLVTDEWCDPIDLSSLSVFPASTIQTQAVATTQVYVPTDTSRASWCVNLRYGRGAATSSPSSSDLVYRYSPEHGIEQGICRDVGK